MCENIVFFEDLHFLLNSFFGFSKFVQRFTKFVLRFTKFVQRFSKSVFCFSKLFLRV